MIKWEITYPISLIECLDIRVTPIVEAFVEAIVEGFCACVRACVCVHVEVFLDLSCMYLVRCVS